jgi:peptidoglycan/xylan/chitin deacetylase (PgdA/CDA1 family)
MVRRLLSQWMMITGMILIAGCVGLQPQGPPRPQPEPPPQALPGPRVSREPEPKPPPVDLHKRVFPEFVAVIAQPGDTFSSLAATYLHDASMDWFIADFNGMTTLNPGQEVIIPLQMFDKGGLNPTGYQTVPVIAYHKFSKGKPDLLTVRETAFEEQMRFLKENGYRVISLEAFFDFLEFKRPIPKKSVVITIDDDWYSTYEIAYPILKKYGYPATLFVYTDLILPGGKTLSWDLLREMSSRGMDIQCHTQTHRNLAKRAGQESFREYFEILKKELAESAEMIRKRLKKEVRYLAYPYGDTNPLIIAFLKKLGYRGAFTVERSSNPFFVHPYRINRSMIYGTFRLKDFENNLTYFDDKDVR